MTKERKNIIIWGTAAKGERTIKIISEYDEFKVIAFGDNDEKRIGNFFCGKIIYGIVDVNKIEDLDCIIIASSYCDEIYTQLRAILTVPIYKDVWELLGRRASIDISGWCNAKCKWCATGTKNRNNICTERKIMSFEKFKKIYVHLINKSILYKCNELLLYSWGEPFLNCDIFKIMEYLSRVEQTFSLSTNASTITLISEGNIYKTCKTIVFSMSGFSQESYNKIHGFSFEIIKENIAKCVVNMRKHGFSGRAILSYHVYQFNVDEIPLAEKYAQSLGLVFEPVYAYFASYGLTKQYLQNALSNEQLEEANKELLLSHVDMLIHERPQNYQCAVKNMISINVAGNIELCCCCDNSVENYEWGSVLNINDYFEWQAMRIKMLKCHTCQECRNLGIDYWFFNNPRYKYIECHK